MDKLVCFDLEYANTHNLSICQMGVFCLSARDWTPLMPALDLYVDPQDNFDEYTIGIHHVTPQRVRSAPSFPQLWPRLLPYFADAVVVGHNVAHSDLHALVRNLRRYGLAIPAFRYIDTDALSRRYVPAYDVPNYRLQTLCQHFGIDCGTAHNASSDALAAGKLLQALQHTYGIDLSQHVCDFVLRPTKPFDPYLSPSALQRELTQFYSTLSGITIDNTISAGEADYLWRWADTFECYRVEPLPAIVSLVRDVLRDDMFGHDALGRLQAILSTYAHAQATSPATDALRKLRGLLRGISIDRHIDEAECVLLYRWLYDNYTDLYPFDDLFETLYVVLRDKRVTADESAFLLQHINGVLDPLTQLCRQLYDVWGKRVCLCGPFSYGESDAVASRVEQYGGILVEEVDTDTDILIIGDEYNVQSAIETYGNKLQYALSLLSHGVHLLVAREGDIFFLQRD